MKLRMRKGGKLTLPKKLRERLGMQEDTDVTVTPVGSAAMISKQSTMPVTPPLKNPRTSKHPLTQILGIGRRGPKDGAVQHDRYRYGSSS